MKKYSITDFTIGEEVYYVSKQDLFMTILEIDINKNKILCRYLDSNFNFVSSEFLANEVGKSSDLPNKGGIRIEFLG